eukprot:SAG31_NODE_1482_length_8175_cov_4.484398_13_plen_72_part_00
MFMLHRLSHLREQARLNGRIKSDVKIVPPALLVDFVGVLWKQCLAGGHGAALVPAPGAGVSQPANAMRHSR